MTLSAYLNFMPQIGERVFIADGAKVIGRAFLADHVSIWFNSVVRADVNEIRIGKNTNVQDLCMFHVTEQNDLVIGENTSFGHSVVLHGCKIGNGCLIGMGSIILDGAEIGDNCLVAAGSLVSPGKKFPAGSLIKGRPAVVERALGPEEIQKVSHHFESYLGYKEQYLTMLNPDEKKKSSDFTEFLNRVNRHNLLMLSASIAYYAALSFAPMLLILLGLAAVVGEDIQQAIIDQVSLIAPDVTEALQIIFKNLKGRVDVGSVSGILSLGFLLFLASFVFMQLRFSLDVIYDDHDAFVSQSFFHLVKKQGVLMLVVLVMCVLFALSLMIGPIFNFVLAGKFESQGWKEFFQLVLNFSTLFILFSGLYFFTPTRRRRIRDCVMMGIITAAAFQAGNILTGMYMRTIAIDSLYGAAGALLIFLLWAFYSSLTIFMSVEVFEFFKEKVRREAAS